VLLVSSRSAPLTPAYGITFPLCVAYHKAVPTFFFRELYSIGHILVWPYASYVEKSLFDKHPTHSILTMEIKSNKDRYQQDYPMLCKEATLAALPLALKAMSP
jgi:hypothetical protein